MSIQRSLALGGLSKALIQHRLGRQKSRAHLIERLGHLHGLPQKMAQLMALNEMTLEEVGQDSFTTLTEYTTTLDFESVQSILNAVFKPSYGQIFSHLHAEGISASLGQVHSGILTTGEKVAVKVQYPQIRQHVETDLKALGWLTLPIGGFKGFDMASYQTELKDMLTLELDYLHELKMLQLFRDLLTHEPDYQIPHAFADYSNAQVLVMSWMEGHSFSRVLSWPAPDKAYLARAMLRFFFLSCFKWRYLHSDPHPGNYRFGYQDDKPFMGILDFGCVKALPVPFSEALHALLTVLIRGEATPEKLFSLFLDLGFQGELLEPMQDKLPALCQVLFWPFLQDQAITLDEWQLSQQVSQILGEDRWNFRFAGPAQLLFFLRSYHGVLKYLKALQAPLNWQALFAQEIGWFNASALATASVAVRPIAAADNTSTNPPAAQFLRIRLLKAGEIKVSLKYRAALAAHLSDIIPDSIEPLLIEHQIVLTELEQMVRDTAFAPGVLCELAQDTLCLKVWLE